MQSPSATHTVKPTDADNYSDFGDDSQLFQAADASVDSESGEDLSALSWVQEELRRSLDAANKALRRHAREAEASQGSDVDVVDPAVLRSARQQLHQGVGALELVGLPAAATLMRACEVAVQRFISKPGRLDAAGIDAIEKASFALLDYVARMLAGKDVSPLSLFPQYRAVQELSGADRVHPADLWSHDWQWHDLPDDPTATPRQPDAATRTALEQQLLHLMRGANPKASAAAMSELCAGLGSGALRNDQASLWKLAAAFFEGLAQGLLVTDVFSKRVASRLLAQFRIIERGGKEVSDRLAEDILFFCSQCESPGDGRSAPRLAAVRQAYGLAYQPVVDYAAKSLGRFDPVWIAQARKRVIAAKDTWSAVAAAELHRLPGLSEQFSLVGDSIERLFPGGDDLSLELMNAVNQTLASEDAPPAMLAMEVATSMLYVEAALEDVDFDHPEQEKRIRRLAARIAAVRSGRAPEPLESWMEDLYHRVSHRQTMGSVVQELRASLSESEQLIDQYFRNPAEREVLVPVPKQLQAMRGVLAVLGMDHAQHAVSRMSEDVETMIKTEADPDEAIRSATFERLADNLGALDFLIDMVAVQPQLAKSVFVYDADAGTLKPLAGRSADGRLLPTQTAKPAEPVKPRLIEQVQSLAVTAVRDEIPLLDVTRELQRLSQQALAADQPALAATVSRARSALENAKNDGERAAAREQLSVAMADFVTTASDPTGLEPERKPAPPAVRVAGNTAPVLSQDDEMLGVFMEEARAVIATARDSLKALDRAPEDLGEMTSLRRAFHTLKGSSRMVGLKEFGDAGWACEQLYNARLADQQPADDDLLKFSGQAIDYFESWVDSIESGDGDGEHSAAPIEAAADALRRTGVHSRPLEVPAPPAPPAGFAPIGMPADLPTAADLDLTPQLEPVSAFSTPLPDIGDGLRLDEVQEPPPEVLPVATTTEIESFEDAIAELQTPAEDFELDMDLSTEPLDALTVQALAAHDPAADPFNDPSSSPFSLDVPLDVPSDDAAGLQTEAPPLPALDTMLEADVPVELPDVFEEPLAAEKNALPSEFLVELPPSDAAFRFEETATYARADQEPADTPLPETPALDIDLDDASPAVGADNGSFNTGGFDQPGFDMPRLDFADSIVPQTEEEASAEELADARLSLHNEPVELTPEELAAFGLPSFEASPPPSTLPVAEPLDPVYQAALLAPFNEDPASSVEEDMPEIVSEKLADELMESAALDAVESGTGDVSDIPTPSDVTVHEPSFDTAPVLEGEFEPERGREHDVDRAFETSFEPSSEPVAAPFEDTPARALDEIVASHTSAEIEHQITEQLADLAQQPLAEPNLEPPPHEFSGELTEKVAESVADESVEARTDDGYAFAADAAQPAPVDEPVQADPPWGEVVASEPIESGETIERVESIEPSEPDFQVEDQPVAEPAFATASYADAEPAPETREPVELFEEPDTYAPEPEPAFYDDQLKMVGPLRISIPLFNIYLNEADELSRRLITELAEWSLELHRPVGETSIALAHSLAGSSATVGFTDLSHLSRLLESALGRSQAMGSGTADEAALFTDVAEEIRRLLHQFAAGFLKSPPEELYDRLADHEMSSARRLEAMNVAVGLRSGYSDFTPLEPAQLSAFSELLDASWQSEPRTDDEADEGAEAEPASIFMDSDAEARQAELYVREETVREEIEREQDGSSNVEDVSELNVLPELRELPELASASDLDFPVPTHEPPRLDEELEELADMRAVSHDSPQAVDFELPVSDSNAAPEVAEEPVAESLVGEPQSYFEPALEPATVPRPDPQSGYAPVVVPDEVPVGYVQPQDDPWATPAEAAPRDLEPRQPLAVPFPRAPVAEVEPEPSRASEPEQASAGPWSDRRPEPESEPQPEPEAELDIDLGFGAADAIAHEPIFASLQPSFTQQPTARGESQDERDEFAPEPSGFVPSGFAEFTQVELKPLSDMPALLESDLTRRLETLHFDEHSEVTGDDDDDDIDAVDAVDAELFPIFEEEALELLPQLSNQIRGWARRPDDPNGAAPAMRTLHTFKGGARLAGAMRLGEMAHRLETRIETVLRHEGDVAAEVEALQSRSDALNNAFEALRRHDAQTYAEAAAAAEHVELPDVALEPIEPIEMAAFEPPALPAREFGNEFRTEADSVPANGFAPETAYEPDGATAGELRSELASEIDGEFSGEPLGPQEPDASAEAAIRAAVSAETPVLRDVIEPADLPGNAQLDDALAHASAAPQPIAEIDWSRFPSTPVSPAAAPRAATSAQTASAVRIRAPLLERMVNQAGEVSITRARLETEVSLIKSSLGDLTDNLQRLREQLRDVEFQAETQLSSRLEAAKAASQAFDPLEFDRFTRLQELTRMMAESVNDVATVQRTLQRALESTEDQLAAQARLTRDLQDGLLRTRMVEFEGLSDRLYRVVRQAAKETGKQVRLDIVGGSIEVDRGVLDRMTGSFEHLVRNCVTHGIESPSVRSAAGKDPTGTIVVALTHEGNEVGVEFRDDGAGLDLLRIREKGEALGLLDPNQQHSDSELANLIFAPGFSTASSITELAGRGIGMDVVRSEVNALGGRIETATAWGKGASFRLLLPLTTAVTQVVMLRSGDTVVAVPSTLVEIVRRATAAEVEGAYASGHFQLGDRSVPFFWLGALLQHSRRGMETTGRTVPVVVIRSAQQRVALHVDEVLGNQEVVVKNLGPQMARMPGLVGITLLASGGMTLIYNPVALATLYGDSAHAAMQAASAGALLPEQPQVHQAMPAAAPLVLVVDDSLTVRRVTQRLLVREGYRVTLAKDGLEALERLADERPAVVLSDIEMPKMDGFDLVRNIRGDAQLRNLPVIMITSRIAQKHRDYAAELGVDHYLGKPYSEEDLVALIGTYVDRQALAAPA
ncbi:hypothetical protein BH09PSE5_BH09PSE5_14160 [soil metagenome]